MSARAEYREIDCRSALNRVTGMPFAWSLNPYRGCSHGCHYCYARRYHAHFDLNAGDEFTGVLFVKKNVVSVLREELSMRSWRREPVALGTATDPYQPIEGKYRLTRGCLQAFADWKSPVNVVTKGPMAVRDIDVLQDLSRLADCSVCLSITTTSAELARRLEPTTAPPRQRLRAVEALARASVRVCVLIAPIVPGLTDGDNDLEDLVRAANEHGASMVGARVLELRPGTKEHFLDYLAEDAPELLSAYRRMYPNHAPPEGRARDIQRRVAELCQRYGLRMREREAPPAARQLAMTL